ncbi:Fruiting body protein SC1 [Trametes pubescens]|uniref:Hydrophobin n=1 Tax=Trametes pubescens TaxID=154538 RepID=A0A1M2VHQ2_TRAPU|nr:Fruiting body protein SC1 [Trametes pubescens]
MFARVVAFSLLALPVFAAATPAVLRRGDCNTGSIQCCNSVHETNENAVSVLLSLLGLDAGSLTGSVGLQCSGISGVGAGQSSCQASPVCCTNNNVGGLISVGCIPIIL